MMIIVDYGIGNLASILNMLRRIGEPARISGDPSVIAKADALILPGVGAFDHAMRALRAGSLLSALETRVLRDGVPTLGLCLGMQLLTHGSEEGDEKGLGWVNANTVRFDSSKVGPRFTIPFMGWSNVTSTRGHPLLATDEDEMRFYFAHSYHVRCDEPELVIGMTQHGYPFPAAIARGNIFGLQFHPEKSHVFGFRLLTNFCMLARGLAAETV